MVKRELRCSRLRGMPDVRIRVAPPLAIAYPVRIRKAPLIRPRMGLTNSQITLYALNEPVACLSTTISAVKDLSSLLTTFRPPHLPGLLEHE